MSVKHTLANGDQICRSNGMFHCDNGPAIIYADGTQVWYNYDSIHRVGGPAIIWPDGRQEWYVNGKRHRDDGPAVICSDDTQQWYINGEYYREPHNAEQMPVIVKRNEASFNGYKFFLITAEEYNKYKHHLTGRRTKAALREN